jgi:hypothetical protein
MTEFMTSTKQSSIAVTAIFLPLNYSNRMVRVGDEFFALSDVSLTPEGDFAAKQALDSAKWAFTLVSTRHFYWQDKKLFLKRIFRTVNMNLWQTHPKDNPERVPVSLAGIICGQFHLRLGLIGNMRAFLLNDIETKEVAAGNGEQIYLGVSRYGLVPRVDNFSFSRGETVIVMTENILSKIELGNLAKDFVQAVENDQQLSEIGKSAFRKVINDSGLERGIIFIVKRI